MKADPAKAGRLAAQQDRFGVQATDPSTPLCDRAEGIHVWDLAGARYLDLAGSAALQGHNHTRIAAAAVDQSLRLPSAPPGLGHDRLAPLLEKLCTLAGFPRAALFNTGAEAADAAAWAARREPDRGGVLTLPGGLGARADRSGPWPRATNLDTLARSASRASVLLAGPLPSPGLRAVRELCERTGLFLVSDERACGLGRTGRCFAWEHEGVRPHGVLLEDGLSGGFHPVAALVGDDELMAGLAPPWQGPAGAGNPVACAVASAALDVVVGENLPDRAAELGLRMQARLGLLAGPGAVRGRGLWATLTLAGPDATRIQADLRREGILVGRVDASRLLVAPPLTIPWQDLEWALARLGEAL